MKLSYKWLREWIEIKHSAEKVAKQLTLAGLEVDSCTPVEDDFVFDIQLTPNRGDCLSVLGIARELAAINNITLNVKNTPVQPVTIQKTLPVKLQAGNACLHYSGRIIENVRNNVETPAWMQERLQRADTKCISPLVDITNYVMLELGNPLHAFDFNNLNEEIVVRQGKSGEQLVLLNNQTVLLDEDILLIADTKKPLALAGIMGGLESSVTSTTHTVFIESAFFSAEAIQGRQRRFNIQTDSAHRWERGVDPQLAIRALERATELVLQICGGSAGPIIDKYLNGEEHYARDLAQLLTLPKFPTKITLTKTHLKRILGIDLATGEVENILTRLGMQAVTNETGWEVYPPSYRFDLRIPDDLIEEVARIYGYSNIPATLPHFITQPPQGKQLKFTAEKIANILVARGYQEVITYSFIDPELQKLCEPDESPLSLLNPIASDLSVMRTSLLPGLLNVVLYNHNRQQERVRCFEHGLCFKDAKQPQHLAGIVCGPLFPEQWRLHEDVDFYALKADVKAILALTNHADEFSMVPKENSIFHPGQCAAILNKQHEIVGFVGAIHPKILQQLGVKIKLYGFEMYLEKITTITLPNYKPLSRFPAVRRDLALIIPESILAQDLSALIRKTAGSVLIELTVFDVYQGKNIPTGKKSLAIGLTLQHQDRTLTDSEVDEKVKEIVIALQQKIGAELRC